MSLTLEVRIGKRGQQWAIANAALEGLAQIANGGLDEAVRVLWDEKTPFGRQRHVDRDKLLATIDRLMPAASMVAKGFQMRIRYPGWTDDVIGGGTSGIRIDGGTYRIWCEDDFWTLTPVPAEAHDGSKVLKNEGSPRRDNVEFQTENMGVVRVEAKKGKSEVAKLLASIRKFVRSSKGETAYITIG